MLVTRYQKVLEIDDWDRFNIIVPKHIKFNINYLPDFEQFKHALRYLNSSSWSISSIHYQLKSPIDKLGLLDVFS